MKQAFSDVFFHQNEDGAVAGLSLGSGHCAEHEEGVRDLSGWVGVPNPRFSMGIQDRKVNPGEEAKKCIRLDFFSCRLPAHPNSGKKTVKLPGARLLVSPSLQHTWFLASEEGTSIDTRPPVAYAFGRSPEKHDALYIDGFSPEPSKEFSESDPLIQSQWNKGEFQVSVWGAARVEALKKIHEALLGGKAAISTGASKNLFCRGGLHVMPIDQMFDEAANEVLQSDEAHKALTLAVEETGIESALKTAGLRWHALLPRFVETDSKRSILFWLNPAKQEENNYGWFSEADLRAWIGGEGPIPKK